MHKIKSFHCYEKCTTVVHFDIRNGKIDKLLAITKFTLSAHIDLGRRRTLCSEINAQLHCPFSSNEMVDWNFNYRAEQFTKARKRTI